MVLIDIDMDKKESAELVSLLLRNGVSVWKLHKTAGVSYFNARAWSKGWWNPDYEHFMKLKVLEHQMMRDGKITK